MTEAELPRSVGDSFAGDGARCSYRIIGSGGNGAYPLTTPGATALANGDAVVMDIAAVKAAIQRTSPAWP